jgi:hypothetical protein
MFMSHVFIYHMRNSGYSWIFHIELGYFIWFLPTSDCHPAGSWPFCCQDTKFRIYFPGEYTIALLGYLRNGKPDDAPPSPKKPKLPKVGWGGVEDVSGSPLVNIQKAMENGPFIDGLPIKDGDFL